MKNILNNEKGETLVEILVSFVLLLLFTALFTASLRYARTMSQKAESLRETAYELTTKVYPAASDETGGTAAPNWQTRRQDTYEFGAFSVPDVGLQSLDAQSDDGAAAYTFHRYEK